MRRHGLSWFRLAAWLGVIALGLNALVPIHFVFDLADALEPAHHAPAAATGLERQILALLSGHAAAGHHHRHHGKPGGVPGCPVCAAAATLTALALPTVAAPPAPIATAVRLPAVPIVAVPPAAPAPAYRSRAPPTA